MSEETMAKTHANEVRITWDGEELEGVNSVAADMDRIDDPDPKQWQRDMVNQPVTATFHFEPGTWDRFRRMLWISALANAIGHGWRRVRDWFKPSPS